MSDLTNKELAELMLMLDVSPLKKNREDSTSLIHRHLGRVFSELERRRAEQERLKSRLDKEIYEWSDAIITIKGLAGEVLSPEIANDNDGFKDAVDVVKMLVNEIKALKAEPTLADVAEAMRSGYTMHPVSIGFCWIPPQGRLAQENTFFNPAEALTAMVEAHKQLKEQTP